MIRHLGTIKLVKLFIFVPSLFTCSCSADSNCTKVHQQKQKQHCIKNTLVDVK